MKKINWIIPVQLVLALFISFMPLEASAQLNRRIPCPAGMNCTAGGTVNDLISTVIGWVLGITFGVAVLFLVIGGFWYITSAGNEEVASKGKNTVVNALIGIVIIALSYIIVSVVSSTVSSGVSGGIAP